MRVIFLTHYFPPEVGAPQSRIASLALGLRRRGHEVTVHTNFPNYPSGSVMAPYRNRPLVRDLYAGAVPVVRSAVYTAPNAGFGRRLANHASFGLTAIATARAAGPADVIVAETPPLFIAAAAVVYSRFKRAPLVVNVADRWPESAVQLGAVQSRRAIGVAERLERACYRGAERITVPTAGLVKDLERLPEAVGKVVHMPPAVDLDRFNPTAAIAASGPLRVLYAGTVGLAHGLATLVDAAKRAGPDHVELTIAGDGAERETVEARAAGVANVRLLGPQPHDRIPELYAQADAAAVLLRDKPLFQAALPTKMLEAMAAGRPLIVSARGEAARLVEEAGAGLVVEPESPSALADAIETLAADRELARRLGAAGRRLAETRFDRAQSVDAWAELLESVARR